MAYLPKVVASQAAHKKTQKNTAAAKAEVQKVTVSTGKGTSSGSKGSGSGGSSGYTQTYTGGNAELDSMLQAQGKKYRDAAAAGDWQAMQRANEAANQARNQYGYAAEYAYDDINRVRNLYGGGASSTGSSASGSGGAAANTTTPTTTPQGPDYTDYRDELQEMYDKQAAAEKAAIDAYIQQTVNSLNAQKSDVNQNADEMARQAYISYMLSADKMPQALSAAGYSGGMADSQRLALESGLQNSQNEIALNRDNTLNGIDTAITNARLEGSIQGAQSQADIGRDAISAFQNYMQQKNAYANQDFWAKYGYDYDAAQAAANRAFQAGQSQLDRDWQSAESDKSRQQSGSTTAQKQAYDSAWKMILDGVLPTDDLLSAARISKADAQAHVAEVQRRTSVQSDSGGSYSGGGGSGGNGNTATPGDGAPAGGGTVTQEQYDAAADRFDAGDFSREVIDTMVAAGDPRDALNAAISRYRDLLARINGMDDRTGGVSSIANTVLNALSAGIITEGMARNILAGYGLRG